MSDVLPFFFTLNASGRCKEPHRGAPDFLVLSFMNDNLSVFSLIHLYQTMNSVKYKYKSTHYKWMKKGGCFKWNGWKQQGLGLSYSLGQVPPLYQPLYCRSLSYKPFRIERLKAKVALNFKLNPLEPATFLFNIKCLMIIIIWNQADEKCNHGLLCIHKYVHILISQIILIQHPFCYLCTSVVLFTWVQVLPFCNRNSIPVCLSSMFSMWINCL